jgi:hypothetical protein
VRLICVSGGGFNSSSREGESGSLYKTAILKEKANYSRTSLHASFMTYFRFQDRICTIFKCLTMHFLSLVLR